MPENNSENVLQDTLHIALEESIDSSGLELLDGDSEYTTEVGRKSENIKKQLEDLNMQTTSLLFAFSDADGEPLEPREQGTLSVQLLALDDLFFPGTPETQMRKSDLDVYTLQRNLEQVGLLNPIHVVPYGREVGVDALGNPIFQKYIVLDGRRRYEAYRNLGENRIPALVDTTINKQLIDVYQGMIQTVKGLTFKELVDYSTRLKADQPTLTPEMVENFLGLKSGEFLKSQYIDQMKVDYPDIYSQVDKGKMTIEQGFKKLEKEIEKAEKQSEQDGDMSEDDINDALRNQDDLTSLQIEKHNQKVGDRHILDAVVRRAVESRDHGECQACGYGHGEEDFAGVFNVHHMVAVMYGGSDSKNNLILLCQNCHKLVHDYEKGRFNPDTKTFDKYVWVKRIVVLGNILQQQRIQALAELKKGHKPISNQVQKGAIGLGKAIAKAKLDLKGEERYNNSPYDAFIEATADLDLGGELKGELGVFEHDDDEKSEVNVDDYVENEDSVIIVDESPTPATTEKANQMDLDGLQQGNSPENYSKGLSDANHKELPKAQKIEPTDLLMPVSDDIVAEQDSPNVEDILYGDDEDETYTEPEQELETTVEPAPEVDASKYASNDILNDVDSFLSQYE